MFGLDEQDAELLTIAAAPDLDANLALAFGLLRGGPSPARATVGLALELASLPTLSGAGPTYLGPTALTRRHGLLEVSPAPALWLSRELWVPDRVLAHLVGVDEADPLLTPALVLPVPVDRLDVDGLLAAAVTAGEPLVWIRSPLGSGGLSLAAAALSAAGIGCLALDLARVAPSADLRHVLAVTTREAALQGAGLVLVHAERLAEHDPATLFAALAESVVPVLAVGDRPWQPLWLAYHPLVLEAPAVTTEDRALVWDNELGAGIADHRLATFRLAPEVIADAARYATTLADVTGTEISADSARAAARRVGGSITSGPALVPTRPTDLRRPGAARPRVPPAAPVRVLGRAPRRGPRGRSPGRRRREGDRASPRCSAAAPAPARRSPRTSSPPSWASTCSGWTWRRSSTSTSARRRRTSNASSTRRRASTSCSSSTRRTPCSGKRSDVKDAHDRYANQEVAYLLQRMESFDGVTVLATNLRGNLDPAFSRRMSFIVHFPDPDVPTRQRLWERHLARVTTDPADPVQVAHLAQEVELAGGDIRNIVLAAAYDAVAAGELVGMRHVLAATVAEHHKLGRRVPEHGFAQ